jgi:hypothetical protein
MKQYQAMIWNAESKAPGRRASVVAESLEDARRKLEAEHGVGTVFDLHNIDDAQRPR